MGKFIVRDLQGEWKWFFKVGKGVSHVALSNLMDTFLDESLDKRFSFDCNLQWSTYPFIVSSALVPVQQEQKLLAEVLERYLRAKAYDDNYIASFGCITITQIKRNVAVLHNNTLDQLMAVNGRRQKYTTAESRTEAAATGLASRFNPLICVSGVQLDLAFETCV